MQLDIGITSDTSHSSRSASQCDSLHRESTLDTVTTVAGGVAKERLCNMIILHLWCLNELVHYFMIIWQNDVVIILLKGTYKHHCLNKHIYESGKLWALA